jgi:hypothetical protein
MRSNVFDVLPYIVGGTFLFVASLILTVFAVFIGWLALVPVMALIVAGIILAITKCVRIVIRPQMRMQTQQAFAHSQSANFADAAAFVALGVDSSNYRTTNEMANVAPAYVVVDKNGALVNRQPIIGDYVIGRQEDCALVVTISGKNRVSNYMAVSLLGIRLYDGKSWSLIGNKSILGNVDKQIVKIARRFI